MSKPVAIHTPKEALERYSRIIRGYMAFISALLLVLLANRVAWPLAWLPEVLFALSLPSLVALEALEYLYAAAETPAAATMRGVAVCLGGIPSMIGLCIVVGHTRWYAGVLLGVLIIVWFIAIKVGVVNELDRLNAAD